MAHNKNTNSFSRADISDAIRIWERAAISLMDIRHNLISADEAVRDYRLPASTFIYTSGANAEILLNDQSFRVDQFGVFHAGKGTTLSILPANGWLEYYILLYKAGEPPFHKKEFGKLVEHTNPFRQQYGFAPSNPLFFGHQLRLMYEKWKGPTPLNLFYGKAAFYQLIYEVYEELEKGRIRVFEPDLIGMATRYMDQHYSDAISIQEVCDMLGMSYSHFHRRFTKQLGKSPQEYLIQTRLVAAIECLNNEEASVREIAEYCGFSDEYNFHRLFLKSIGMTPGAYREKSSAKLRDEIIGNVLPFPYNEQGQVSLGKLKGKGTTHMLRQMRSKAAVAAMISLLLLFSACGTQAANSSSSLSAESSQVTTEESKPVEGGTRIVSTVMGDVEVPVNPQRIACYHWAGDLLSIGITPIASDLVELAPIKDLLKDSKLWIARDLSSQEALMAMEPDLIMVSSQEEYDTYHKIAPTIVVPYETPLEVRMKLWGEIFQKQDEAQTVLKAFNDKVERYKEDLKEIGIYGQTIAISVFRNDNGTLFLCGDNFGYGAEIIYGMFDFKIPDIIQKELIDTGVQIQELSWEVVPEFLKDVDYLQVTVYDDGLWTALKDNEIWNSVPVVKQNKIIEYSSDYESASLLVMDKALDAYYEQFMELAKTK